MRYRTDCPKRPDFYLFSARLYPGAELELLERASQLALEPGEKLITNRALITRALTEFVTAREQEHGAQTEGTADEL